MSKISWKGSTLLGPIPPALITCGTLEQPSPDRRLDRHRQYPASDDLYLGAARAVFLSPHRAIEGICGQPAHRIPCPGGRFLRSEIGRGYRQICRLLADRRACLADFGAASGRKPSCTRMPGAAEARAGQPSHVSGRYRRRLGRSISARPGRQAAPRPRRAACLRAWQLL